MEFANFVKNHREKKYKFPKTFYNEANLSCGYVYYLDVERGLKIPTGKVAVEILEALKANVKQGLLAWNRDQFEDERHKAMFRTSLHLLSGKKNQLPKKQAMTINRMQAKLLRKDPIYWEITYYLSIFSHLAPINKSIIAKEFGLDEKILEPYLLELYEYGLIENDHQGNFYTKEWVFIPNEKEFADIRDQNFERAISRFFKNKTENSFRTTHHRTVTPTQRETIIQNILSLLEGITDLPDDPQGKAFTIGIFAGERDFERL